VNEEGEDAVEAGEGDWRCWKPCCWLPLLQPCSKRSFDGVGAVGLSVAGASAMGVGEVGVGAVDVGAVGTGACSWSCESNSAQLM
jgi:hypothetical protein